MNETLSGWFVAHTKPRAESLAQANLLRQNYQVRLPMVRKIVRRKPSLEPLFPRYLFVRPAHSGQSLSPIRSTTGVSTLVRFGMNLALLSDEQCDRIMEFAQAQQQGGLNAMLEVQGIRIGQRVLIKEGPFVGLEGLVSKLAKDRVMVLMNLLGKEQTLSFPATDLSAA